MAVPPPSSSPEKIALRRRLRSTRAEHVARLSEDGLRIAAEIAAAQRVLDHIAPGASVAIYHAFPNELDPAPLAGILAARGHPLALPHLAPDGTTLRFLSWVPGDTLVRGSFGVMQPVTGHDVGPAAVLTPLLGFDRKGGRIGQGAGHYDRAFAAMPGVIRIGYAWSVQEVEAVPLDPWDMPLNAVATEHDWIRMDGSA
jgi:5-formyltetrahydrofolate cyclo-ligase